MKRMTIHLNVLRLDGDTQPRVKGIDQAVVDEYADAIDAGAFFPPLKAVHDGKTYWLYSGFHRHAAYRKAGVTDVEVEVVDGTQKDAQWLSLAENQSHGLRRTNADKKRAVTAALKSRPKAPDREIAEHVGVDNKTVAKVRHELSEEIPQMRERTVTRGGTTYTQNTTNIGKKPVVHVAPEERGDAWEAGPEDDPTPTRHWDANEFEADSDHVTSSLNALSGGSESAPPEGNRAIHGTISDPDDPSDPRNYDLDHFDPEARALFEHGIRSMPESSKQRIIERDAKHRQKQREVKETKRDALGTVLPDRLRDVFGDPAMPESLALLEEWAALLKSSESLVVRLKGRSQALPWLKYGVLIDELGAARGALSAVVACVRAGMPHAVCPTCKGQGCADCRASGYVPDWRLEELKHQEEFLTPKIH
jgi:hypothetical protein